jgi:SPP1 family predicted phage head-tail adaptor
VGLTAASLSSRIELQQPSSSQDALGQPVAGWSSVATVWADVRFPTGLAAINADARTSATRASVRIRMRRDVQPGWRVVFRSAAYLVQAVLPDEQHRDAVDLVCERVQ